MSDPKYEPLIAAAGMSAFAAAGGWAITSKVAGVAAGQACFFLLVAMALPVLALQLLLCYASTKRLLYTIAYRTTLVCTLILFLCALLFPAYWIPAVDLRPKLAVTACIVLWSAWSFRRGLRAFDAAWAARGEALLARHCRAGVTGETWKKVMIALEPSNDKLLPGLNDLANVIVVIAVFVLWGLGMSLRKTVPVLSLYAWAPFPGLFIAYVVSLASIGLGEMFKLREIEAATGTRVLPEQDGPRRTRRARR